MVAIEFGDYKYSLKRICTLITNNIIVLIYRWLNNNCGKRGEGCNFSGSSSVCQAINQQRKGRGRDCRCIIILNCVRSIIIHYYAFENYPRLKWLIIKMH